MMKPKRLIIPGIIISLTVGIAAVIQISTEVYGKRPVKSLSAPYFVVPQKGVDRVVKADLPLKGDMKMELEVRLELEPEKVSSGTPLFFHNVARMKDGRLLFSDYAGFKIHMVSREGTLIRSFLGKGEGPGEFPYGIFTVQPKENVIYAAGKRKIIRFDQKGRLLDERVLKREYRNVYMLDNGRFIANYFDTPAQPEGSRKANGEVLRHYKCALFDRQEKIIEKYIDAPGAGSTRIRETVDGRRIRLNFYSVYISPEIMMTPSPGQQRIFLCLTSQYRVLSRELNGRGGFIIEKEHPARQLTAEDRDELVATSFMRQPPHVKKIIHRELPSTFCKISNIQVLPGGYLAVMTITGIYTLPAIDIYDNRGRYLYRLEFPDSRKRLLIRFFGSDLAALEESESGDIIYREYRIKNLEGELSHKAVSPHD